MELYRRISRYWNTIRYLRPAQLVSRLDLRTRMAARNLSPATARASYATRAARTELAFVADPWQLRTSVPCAASLVPSDAVSALEREAGSIAGGTFDFLNDRRHLGYPVDWTAPGAAQLWRYHLHYFDYVADLTIAGASPHAWSLVIDWIDRVPLAEPSTRDAWHPYVVSVRLVNWMVMLATAPDGVAPTEQLIESLRVQTLFVRDNLETDVGGNHLLKNLKALAVAGAFWRGDEASMLCRRFTTEFVRCLTAQLRTDGGHYEQSPMYHAQVLSDAIELAIVLRQTSSVHPELERLIERMEAFLLRVRHPDGDLARFGDTASGMAPSPQALIAASALLQGRDPGRGLTARHALIASSLSRITARNSCRPEPRPDSGVYDTHTLPEAWDPQASGFLSLATADGRGFLIADAGPVCPDDLPAHAHSDTFGFEVSVDGLRFVVDSGVSEYSAGPWRDYFRSTRAHNTVVVDDAEQSDCWSSFRVGRRARVIDGRIERGAEARGFSAAHTGFHHLPDPVTHRRHFLLVAGRFWLIVDDLLGSGSHRWESSLHLHPEVQPGAPVGSRLLARRGGTTLGVGWVELGAPVCIRGQHHPLQGWYAPAFGQVLPSDTLVAGGSGQLPVRAAWLLVPGAGDGEFGVRSTGQQDLIVAVGNQRYEIQLAGPGDERLHHHGKAARR